MKIKNIKYYSMALLLATSISFTGCGSTNKSSETKPIIETTLENELSTEDNIIIKPEIKQNKSDDTIQNIADYFNNSIILKYYQDCGILTIFGPLENQIIPELTDELYEKLNTLLEQSDIQYLEIHRLGNEIDFSKLNLSNIKYITLDKCKEDFNYEPFQNQKFDNIILENIPVEQATNIVEKASTPNTSIDYISFNISNESSSFIKSLADTGIPVKSLYIATNECNQVDHFHLSRINATNIEIMFTTPTDQVYNLEFDANENIESLQIWDTGSNIELGNITVTTNCPTFQFSLNGYNSRITETTHFSLPNNSSAIISSGYETGSSLKELSNVDELSYYDFNTDEEIYYYKDLNNFDQIIDEFLNSTQNQYKKELQ